MQLQSGGLLELFKFGNVEVGCLMSFLCVVAYITGGLQFV